MSLLLTDQKRFETILQIRMYIWRRFGFTEVDLIRYSRDPKLEDARYTIWYLLYSKARMTTADLGQRYLKTIDAVASGLRSVEDRRRAIEDGYEDFLSTYPHP